MRQASVESNSEKFGLGSLSDPDIKDHIPVVTDHYDMIKPHVLSACQVCFEQAYSGLVEKAHSISMK